MPKPRAVLRFDGGPRIGYGHAIRSMALGTALQRLGFEVTVLSCELGEQLLARADALDFRVEVVSGSDDGRSVDDPRWVEVIAEADAVVVDGYPLGDELRAIRHHAPVVVAIDDNLELPVELATIVLNQNPYATVEMYRHASPAQLLLGTRFVLLRDEVRAAGHHEGRAGCFVSFGGADPLRLTLPTVELLAADSIPTVVAFGTSHPDASRLSELVAASPNLTRDGGDLLDALRTARVGVIGAGTTLYEVATAGIPTIAVVIAENQVHGSAFAAQTGWVELAPADPHQIVEALARLLGDSDRQHRMRSVGASTVDGHGSDRVAAVISTSVAGR